MLSSKFCIIHGTDCVNNNSKFCSFAPKFPKGIVVRWIGIWYWRVVVVAGTGLVMDSQRRHDFLHIGHPPNNELPLRLTYALNSCPHNPIGTWSTSCCHHNAIQGKIITRFTSFASSDQKKTLFNIGYDVFHWLYSRVYIPDSATIIIRY